MAEVPKPKIFKEQFKPGGLPSGVPWRLFTSTVLLVLLVVLVYTGLNFGYKPYLNSRIQDIDQQLQQLSAAISQEDQDNFIRFYSQLVNFNKILEKHALPSKLFPFLESITNKKVLYTNLDLRVDEKRLSLEGVAASYKVLSEQLAAYDQEPTIESYMLNQSQYSEGVVRFKATLILKEEVLK